MRRFASEIHRLLHRKQIEAVQRVMDSVRPQRTLEIAPGPGRLTRDVKPTGSLAALEFNQEMITQGRAACREQVEWIRGDAFQLPFAANHFDFIYAFRFVRHFRIADRNRLYDEIVRVMKPGGYFVMDAVNARVSVPLRNRNPEDYPIFDEQYLPDELRSELIDAGFSEICFEPVQKCFSWQYRSQVLLGPRINWLNRLVVGALEKLPVRDGLEWIVTCRSV